MRVIIDGDILTFRAASVHPDSLTHAKRYLKDLMAEVHDHLFLEQDNTLIFVGGDGINFRKHYDDYKANRKGTEKPASLADLNAWVVKHYEGGSYAGDCESDDRVLIEAQSCINNDEDYVIVSTDKDLKTIQGKHFNPMKMEMAHITQVEAEFFLNKQLLMGDSADGIKGLPGIGPKKAQAHLEMYEDWPLAVCDLYKQILPDNWMDELTKTWNLIYIRRYDCDIRIMELPDVYNR